MKRKLLTSLIVTVLASPLASWAQTGVTVAASATPPAITAEITATQKNAEPQTREVEIVGRTANALTYRQKGGPKEASLSIDLSTVTSLDFDFQFESEPYNKALLSRNWIVVATTLWPIITPLTPYLDIKDNNASSYAYIMASSMIKVAEGHRKAHAEDKARRLYVEANKVFDVLAKGEWFEDADASRLKAILCLIAVTNYPLAEAQLKAAHTPEIGDASWGLYWYTQALLKFERGNLNEAMNAVTQSITFETKDIDVFPDALLLSARLYEELQEPYSARDVYYEVAKIFPDTEWATTAREHLKFIMDKGLTTAKEKSRVELVFFGLKEDMNAKAMSFLKGEDKPPIIETGDTSIEVDEADMQSGKKDAPSASNPNAPPPDPDAPPPAPVVNGAGAAKQAGKASAGAKAAKTEALK